jgi:hypothetical protein
MRGKKGQKMQGGFCLPRARNTCGFAAACFVIVLVCAGCGTKTASQSAVSGAFTGSAGEAAASEPVLGYTWDSSRAGLRTMLGVPGAAKLSDNLVTTEPFTSAIFCLRKSYVLLTNSSGSVYLMSLPNGEPALITSPLGNQQVVVSPSCSKALVYARGGSTGVLIGGLPSAPEMEPLNFAAPGSIAAAAVGDLGDVALAVLRSDGSTAIQLLSSSGGLSAPLSVLQTYGAMTFVPGGDTLLVGDSGANRVVMVSHPSTNPSVAQLASSADGVSQPLAIASSADGREAFVANAVGVPLLRLNLASTSAPAKVPCTCRPSELIPLSGNALFQVSDLSSGTIYALDGAPAVPRTLFIPASNSASLSGAAR